MKNATFALIAGLLLAGCAGQTISQEGEMAPFKAIVVFQWVGEDPAAAKEAASPADQEVPGGGPQASEERAEPAPAKEDPASPSDSRIELEDSILNGLEDHQVFSDFVCTGWTGMEDVARSENADLILLVRIQDLGRWDQETTRISTGIAILNTVLWIGTGIGGWWVPDVGFPTRSDVEVFWKRPNPPESPPAAAPPDPKAQLGEFKLRERLSSGEYQLSFWDRAKPWRYFWPYLLNIVVPPTFVPLRDPEEVDRSLQSAALEDIQRELARKLKGGYLQAGGSPFLFRLESPRNGAAVQDARAKLLFSYRIVPGFEEHEATRLSSLAIDVKRAEGQKYERLRTYEGNEIRAINEKIGKDEPIEEEVQGLRTGTNLIRFVARTEIGGLWITNTVAIIRP